jgi:hypothetical protein
MTYAIAAGCSHTAGVGIELHNCYASYVSRHYNIPVLNLGVPAGNHAHVLMNIVETLKDEHRPAFVIAQWPNPIRRTVWTNGVDQLQNIHNAGPAFTLLLKSGEENFYEDWLQSIIVSNLLCKLAEVPIVNIMLEDIEDRYHVQLDNKHIKLHTDQKLPGLTWLFDSAATDQLHHSAYCHKQWADRLIGLIDEITTR